MFPVARATLLDRDGSLIKEIDLTRFWNAPPKIIVDGKDYYIRISDDTELDPAVYRMTKAVRHLDS